MSRPAQHIHDGNLVIYNAADAEKYRNVTKVTGNLYINTSAKLDALKSVGGYLYINTSAKLAAPQLESVGGYLSIYASAKLDALKSVGGDLSINASAKLDALKSVGGYLSIYASAKLAAPQLESVGGYLYINASAKLDALKSVGGYLSIYASAKLDALKSVGGDLSIYASAKLDALKSVGGDLSINAKGSLIAGKLYCGGYSKFKVIDGIGCVVLSEKKQGDVTILMCRRSKIKSQKVIGDKFYVARNGGNYAHGKTIAEATQELLFKTGSRDVSQYRNMPKDTAKSPAEWALIYRMVTGACQMGVKVFIESRGTLKKKYTLTEIIAITKGQFGHQRFVETVGS